jgi:hypothetical protein
MINGSNNETRFLDLLFRHGEIQSFCCLFSAVLVFSLSVCVFMYTYLDGNSVVLFFLSCLTSSSVVFDNLQPFLPPIYSLSSYLLI